MTEYLEDLLEEKKTLSVRLRRTGLKLSQTEIAGRLGVSVATWQRWESKDEMTPLLSMALSYLEREFFSLPLQAQAMRDTPKPGRPPNLLPSTIPRLIFRDDGLRIDDGKLEARGQLISHHAFIYDYGLPPGKNWKYGLVTGLNLVHNIKQKPFPEPLPQWLQDLCQREGLTPPANVPVIPKPAGQNAVQGLPPAPALLPSMNGEPPKPAAPMFQPLSEIPAYLRRPGFGLPPEEE